MQRSELGELVHLGETLVVVFRYPDALLVCTAVYSARQHRYVDRLHSMSDVFDVLLLHRAG